MNGDMNGAMEESLDASSQESAYNSAGATTSEPLTLNDHSDSSNQDDDSNLGADSNGELSNKGDESSPEEECVREEVVGNPDSTAADGGGPADNSNQPGGIPPPETQEQNGSNPENKESADSSDKESGKRIIQGAPVGTVNEDSIVRDINVVITTSVRSRENHIKSGGNSASSLMDDSNNHNTGSDSGTKLLSGSASAKVSDSSEAKSAATADVVVDSVDNSNNKPNSNNLHSVIGAQLSASRSRKRAHGDPEGSGLPLKKVLPDTKSNNLMLEGNIDDMDSKIEVDSTTNVDSCDSVSGNPRADDQGVTSQNNCINSDSAESGNIKEDSSSEESEREEAQHVHEIQSDSEDDVRRVSSKQGEAESDDMDSDEDSSDEECTDGSDGEIPNDEHVSINSDTEPEAIDDDSSKDSNPREAGEVLLVDDTSNHVDDKRNKINKMKSDEDVHEVSDNDDIADGIPAEARAVIDMYPGVRHKLMDVTRKLMTNAKEMERQVMAGMKNASENAIIVNDTKDLAGLAKSKVSDKEAGEKKEPTVVIIDTNSSVAGKSAAQLTKGTYPVLPIDASTASLYQSIAARGTTVTPVATKSSTITVSTTTATPTPILPSLTDDMFVVEAPSFIVPYVYEKPSVKPFREFVDVMGKELDDKRLKEEKEKLEKEKLKPEIKKDKPDEVPVSKTGETVEVPKVAGTEEVLGIGVEESPKKKKSDKKAKKRNDDDDASWDGTSSSESDDDVISDDDTPKTIIIKEKEDDSLDGIKDPTTTTDLISEIKNTKSDNYFDNSLGKFFINIGVNLVQEYVQADLLKQQKRKLYKENRSGSGNVKGTEMAIKSLSKNLEFSRDNNAPYKFQQKKCEFCSFKSESALAMAHHMETPHMKNNIYKCNFCAFEIRSPHDILYHMEAEHNTRGRLERAPAYHQCANCPFEDNGKGKLARHLVACAKKFKPDHNLGPPVEWEPPAKIPKQMTRARHTMMSTYQAAFTKTAPTPAVNLAALYRGRGRPTAPLPTLVNSGPRPIPGAPLVRGGLVYRPNQALMLPTNFQLLPGGQTTIKANPLGTVQGSTKTMQHQPSISITPLPRAPVQAPPPLAPLPGTPGGPPSKATFVICEICDGYIKDLDQLRNHMQWIHKVKIHPKMIYNRPPLNCQKCQFRFFTDQGLERHLLGSHGLVTSSMQEAANRGKDAGRCPACGRVYQWKLLNHVARDHNMTLKPAHLSYKCTVCTATFGMYKQFENHVYSAHSVVAKRVTEKNKSASPSPAGPSKQVAITDSLLKPLKINDEITIIPQPNKTSRNTDK